MISIPYMKPLLVCLHKCCGVFCFSSVIVLVWYCCFYYLLAQYFNIAHCLCTHFFHLCIMKQLYLQGVYDARMKLFLFPSFVISALNCSDYCYIGIKEIMRIIIMTNMVIMPYCWYYKHWFRKIITLQKIVKEEGIK